MRGPIGLSPCVAKMAAKIETLPVERIGGARNLRRQRQFGAVCRSDRLKCRQRKATQEQRPHDCPPIRGRPFVFGEPNYRLFDFENVSSSRAGLQRAVLLAHAMPKRSRVLSIQGPPVTILHHRDLLATAGCSGAAQGQQRPEAEERQPYCATVTAPLRPRGDAASLRRSSRQWTWHRCATGGSAEARFPAPRR
jgi:hypothetical protein